MLIGKGVTLGVLDVYIFSHFLDTAIVDTQLNSIECVCVLLKICFYLQLNDKFICRQFDALFRNSFQLNVIHLCTHLSAKYLIEIVKYFGERNYDNGFESTISGFV